jgi:hypothetical protein
MSKEVNESPMYRELEFKYRMLENQQNDLIRTVDQMAHTLQALQSALEQLYLGHDIERVALDQFHCDYKTHDFMNKITTIIENISGKKTPKEG